MEDRAAVARIYDQPPYPAPPQTLSHFLYAVLAVPFMQGVAQGLGTACAVWLVGRAYGWTGWRWLRLPARMVQARHQAQVEATPKALAQGAADVDY